MSMINQSHNPLDIFDLWNHFDSRKQEKLKMLGTFETIDDKRWEHNLHHHCSLCKGKPKSKLCSLELIWKIDHIYLQFWNMTCSCDKMSRVPFNTSFSLTASFSFFSVPHLTDKPDLAFAGWRLGWTTGHHFTEHIVSQHFTQEFTLPGDGRWSSKGALVDLTVFASALFVGVYFQSIMIMCTLSVIMSVMVLNFHHRKPEQYVMPGWVCTTTTSTLLSWYQ